MDEIRKREEQIMKSELKYERIQKIKLFSNNELEFEMYYNNHIDVLKRHKAVTPKDFYF